MGVGTSGGTIRRARVDEAALLTELTLRAVGHWGYDAAFMDWCREGVRVRPEYLREQLPRVLDEAGCVSGFYILRGEAPELDLHFLMVEPHLIGSGRGKRLFQHAVETTRGRGATVLTIDSDPHAEAFCRALGVVTIGLLPRHPPHLLELRLRAMRLALAPTGG
jgi:GNAT superfamily N-acetyltransferase